MCDRSNAVCVESLDPAFGELRICYHSVEVAERARRAGEFERRRRVHEARRVTVWVEDGLGEPMFYWPTGIGGTASSNRPRSQDSPVNRDRA